MEIFQEILKYEFAGNTVWNFAFAFLFFLALLAAFKGFKSIIVRRFKALSKETRSDIDNELIKIINNISPLFYFVIALYFPINFLSISPQVDFVAWAVFLVVLVYQVVVSLTILIEYALKRFAQKSGGGAEQEHVTFAGLKLIIQLLLWGTGALLILSNLGFNINSLLASLGIGGIAVALAVQNILADMFSSFSIYFDKPFEIGDFITVGTDSGTVKKIGLKTTRLMTLQGQELVISNKELTSTRVENFKRMKKRRVVFNLRFVYSTPNEKLKKVEKIFKNVIDGIDGAELDRIHFFEFGEQSLNFECVYYQLSPDYVEYMDDRQAINFAIKEAFDKEGIEMAVLVRETLA